MLKIAHDTSLFTALMTTILLKGFHLFEFINWHPTKFLHSISSPFLRFVMLGFMIYILSMIIFGLSMILLWPGIASFLLAIAIVVVVECIIMHKPIDVKNVSVSFFALTIIACRFMMETASFHFNQTKQSREKLQS